MAPLQPGARRVNRNRGRRKLFALAIPFVLSIWSFSSSAYLTIDYMNTGTKATTSREGDVPEREYFRLCGKKIFVHDMPRVPQRNGTRRFGIRRWRRDLNNAIELAPRVQQYGRTGNQIQELFRSFDMARDRGVALVMHDEGFPVEKVLRKLFLGIEREKLEELFGVTFRDSIEEARRSSYKMRRITLRDAYFYVSNNTKYDLNDTIFHRHHMIQELYRMTSKEMDSHPNSSGVADICSSFHAFLGRGDGVQGNAPKDGGITKRITSKFTVIHSRGLEGVGEKFLARASDLIGIDNRSALDYPADLLTSILTPLGINNHSILMITDGINRGRNRELNNRLSSDPDIGPMFQVVPKQVSTVAGDMMLAILSDVFIGNPVSTFSQYIVQARYALGFGRSYLFARRKGKIWETFCNDEQCFYQWLNMWIAPHPPPIAKPPNSKELSIGAGHNASSFYCEYGDSMYLSLNPGVWAAVNNGEYSSGFEHWQKHGYAEGRKYVCNPKPNLGLSHIPGKSVVPVGDYTFPKDERLPFGESNSLPRVLLFVTTHMSGDHIWFLKSCWPKALSNSLLLRNADIAVYLNSGPQKRYGAIQLLNNTFIGQNLTVHVRKFASKQKGAMMALSHAMLLHWFDDYDWVIRLNPDVIVRNDAFLVDTIQNDHSATALLINCDDTFNKTRAHTDFFAIKPSVLSREAFLLPSAGNAEIAFTNDINETILAKEGHRWIPNANPLTSQCRAADGREMHEAPILHLNFDVHPRNLTNTTCHIPFE
ncbi:hypothetical protein ACHAWF_005184 [Thalassiosira exigua]